MEKWIQVEDNEWVHSPTGSHIEISSTFDGAKVILNFGEYVKTKFFSSTRVAQGFVQEIIKKEKEEDIKLASSFRSPRIIRELFRL